MRKFLIAAAVATSAIAAATPAAAQYYPAQQRGYGYNYNYNQQGLVRSYIVRADQLRQRVERLDGRDRVSEREARRLRNAAIDLQNRTRSYARNGLSGRERQELDHRFAQLQQAIRSERFDGNNRRGNGRWDNDGRRDGYRDYDRDGRNDRYEDDRGRYPG